MAFSQSSLARLYIAEAIKNSSASIRACWTIVFTAATIGALTPAISVLKCEMHIIDPSIGAGDPRSIVQSCRNFNFKLFLDTFWPFFVYFATFMRFYLGGIRTFDIKYNEIFSLINNEIALAEKSADVERLAAAEERFKRIVKYNDEIRHKIEVFWLLFQSLIVVSLAFEIQLPRMFVETYIGLILANACYLTWSILKSNLAITGLEHEVFPEWHLAPVRLRNGAPSIRPKSENLPNHAATWWAVNNYSLGILMLLIMMFKEEFNMYIMLSICSINVIVDFVLTRNFYFPKFLHRYEITLKERQTVNQ